MVSPIPLNPDKVITSQIQDIKIATPELVLQNNLSQLPSEFLASLIFEDIGGQELISITRTDTINGQNVIYQPIKNLSALAVSYGPQRLVPLQNPSNQIFNSFPIKLENYIPASGSGPAGSTVYIDPDTKDLIIELSGLSQNQQVEVQILKQGTIINDRIEDIEGEIPNPGEES